MGILQPVHPRRTGPGRRRAIAAFAALAALASACGSADDSANGAADATSSTTVAEPQQETDTTEASETEPDLATGDTQDADTDSTADEPAIERVVGSVAWEPCGSIECGTLDVPLDYRVTDGETISIAINRVPAGNPDERIGVLLVNPGGPGAPGTDLAERFAVGSFPAEVTDRFDVIGFDPRGVGDSEPAFACGESGEQLEALSAIDELIDEPDEIAAAEAAVQLCVDSIGEAAGLIHTGYVVRDMDEIRRALGEEQISYLGYSYGSLIGVWYATLFPDNVRAMVIDGADNPIDDISDFDARLESAREEIAPIEDLLAEALAACDSDTCPIFNGGDPTGFYLDTVDKLSIVNDANANNPTAGFLGLITPLYNEASWPTLWQALADLQERDDPTLFSSLAEFQLGPDPGAVNITAHINCLDGWALRPDQDRQTRLDVAEQFLEVEEEIAAEFPLIFAVEDNSSSPCNFMDVLGTPALDVPLDGGGAPILVVGNTSDPVTSFGESEELVEETLANGFLVEVDHASHTVYPANPCVNQAVHDVLLDISYPEDRVVCERADTEATTILREVCIAVGPQLNPGLSSDALGEACQRFAASAVERLGEDAALEALESPDPSGAEALFMILQEEIFSSEG